MLLFRFCFCFYFLVYRLSQIAPGCQEIMSFYFYCRLNRRRRFCPAVISQILVLNMPVCLCLTCDGFL